MSSDRTHLQSENELRKTRDLSLPRRNPPSDVAGYEIRQFIGAGAFGEVWAGVDRNTGRRVAIKFFIHKGGVDWSLLSREVEKLVVLSANRYAVQLLEVGWEAEPPYFVMDFIENGSLQDRLDAKGPMPVGEALEVFREVATGLMHLHGKGVLHCDLKPANVLLDEDFKPRLADFGQSRLSFEQSPALGTLFYMAPEQADLNAAADARWDVYALGALLYALLTGAPPHRTPEVIGQIESAEGLPERLNRYRQALKESPRPAAHRQARGVDRALAEIIDQCLEVDPRKRFPTVQSALQALATRDRRRAELPMRVLGFVGPLLLLAVMGLFGWWGYATALRTSLDSLQIRVVESNRFAARMAAVNVARELDEHLEEVAKVDRDAEFRRKLRAALDDPELSAVLEQLCRVDLDPKELALWRHRLRELDARPAGPRRAVEQYLEDKLADASGAQAASWVLMDGRGTHVAGAFRPAPTDSPLGKNYAWRAYFHGGAVDMEPNARPVSTLRPDETYLSPVFPSTATFTWKIAIVRGLFDDDARLLGVVFSTVEMGQFAQSLEEDDPRSAPPAASRALPGSPNKAALRTEASIANKFAVLIGARDLQDKGVILQHPLFDDLLRQRERLPEELSDTERDDYLVPLDAQGAPRCNEQGLYLDPLAAFRPADNPKVAEPYAGEWIAAVARTPLAAKARDQSGLRVLVQERYATAVEPVRLLGQQLLWRAAAALLMVLAVVLGLWWFVLRMMADTTRGAVGGGVGGMPSTSASSNLQDMKTVFAPQRPVGEP